MTSYQGSLWDQILIHLAKKQTIHWGIKDAHRSSTWLGTVGNKGKRQVSTVTTKHTHMQVGCTLNQTKKRDKIGPSE